MPANDNAFKVMVQYHPEQFVQRFLPGAAFLHLLPSELPRESLYADALMRIRYPAEGGTECIFHLEVQSRADPDIAARLSEYALLTWKRERLAVHSFVLYLEPTITPDPVWDMAGPLGRVWTFHFRVIRLWEEPVEEWLAAGQTGLLIFAPLLKGATLATLEDAVAALQQEPDQRERANALNYLVLFAMRRFGRDAVTTFIKENLMLDTYITSSEWYQEIMRRGEQQGKEQGMQHMAQRALEGRFGALAEDIVTALASADEATLEALVSHVTTDTIEQVRERLDLQ